MITDTTTPQDHDRFCFVVGERYDDDLMCMSEDVLHVSTYGGCLDFARAADAATPDRAFRIEPCKCAHCEYLGDDGEYPHSWPVCNYPNDSIAATSFLRHFPKMRAPVRCFLVSYWHTEFANVNDWNLPKEERRMHLKHFRRKYGRRWKHKRERLLTRRKERTMPLSFIECEDVSGEPMNPFVKGHIDTQTYCDALNTAYGTRYTRDDVEHGYMRQVPDSTHRFDHMFYPAERGRGAFPVTRIRDTGLKS